jgi:hypothetical protein
VPLISSSDSALVLMHDAIQDLLNNDISVSSACRGVAGPNGVGVGVGVGVGN